MLAREQIIKMYNKILLLLILIGADVHKYYERKEGKGRKEKEGRKRKEGRSIRNSGKVEIKDMIP